MEAICDRCQIVQENWSYLTCFPANKVEGWFCKPCLRKVSALGINNITSWFILPYEVKPTSTVKRRRSKPSIPTKYEVKPTSVVKRRQSKTKYEN